MKTKNEILLAFYGDDFTGSTDALEFLGRAGVKTILFLDIPTTEMLDRFNDVEAVGIAGMTRAMEPTQMASTLNSAFSALNEMDPRHVHYKVCSTFDSSPHIGNIGVAIQQGNIHFSNVFTPVLVASPSLGRYSAFGNLFARMGIGSDGKIYRLDRHPSMCEHPVTPATESDLMIHLSRQTDQKMGLIDLTDLGFSAQAIISKLKRLVAESHQIVFFDAMYEKQMKKIGEVLDSQAGHGSPFFSVGSSGIEKALCDYWSEKQKVLGNRDWKKLTRSHPILVISGSVSPVTERQINQALIEGFVEVIVDPEAIMNDSTRANAIEKYGIALTEHLKNKKSVIIHTAKGPGDPRVSRLSDFYRQSGWDEIKARRETSIRFGKILGQSALRALSSTPVDRLVIAGGDTSGYVARELGIQAVEMITPLVPGAPVCKAYAPGSPIDGKEVNLKGGQVGDKGYFVKMLRGK